MNIKALWLCSARKFFNEFAKANCESVHERAEFSSFRENEKRRYNKRCFEKHNTAKFFKTRQFNEPRYFSGEVKRPEFYIIILNIEKQLGNDVKRRQAFNQRFLKERLNLIGTQSRK